MFVCFSNLWLMSRDQLETEKTEEPGHGLNLTSSLLVAVGLQLRTLNWVEDNIFGHSML